MSYGVACHTGAVEGRTGTLETATASQGTEKSLPSAQQLSPVPSFEESSGWFGLDLPRPPSVNRFVKNLGNRTPEVQDWMRQCNRYVLAKRPRPCIDFSFEAEITWNIADFGKSDIDNRVKPLLDYLQRVRIIANDKWCRRLVIDWDKIELGCQVAVRPWVPA